MKNIFIPDITLEQYLLNELPDKKKKEIDVISREHPEILDRIENIRKSDINILAEYPAEKISGLIRGRIDASEKEKHSGFKLTDGHGKKKSTSSKRIKRYILPCMGIAAVIAFIFIMPELNRPFNPQNTVHNGDRIKGNESALYVYRKNGGSVDYMKNGSIAKKGDLLQVAYMTQKDKYGIIVSIDGRGSVTLHYPAEKDYSTKLDTGKKVLLQNAYELDDAPDFERFFFISSESKLDMSDVNDVLNTARSISGNREKVMDENVKLYHVLSVPVNQVSVNIVKEK
jgi:hypothetical protein